MRHISSRSDLDCRARRPTDRDLIPSIALVLGVCIVSGAAAQGSDSARAESRRLRLAGLASGYNLDYPEALDAFRAAIHADPADPAPHRLFAATLWIRALFAQGAVTADDYLGQARSSVARTYRATVGMLGDLIRVDGCGFAMRTGRVASAARPNLFRRAQHPQRPAQHRAGRAAGREAGGALIFRLKPEATSYQRAAPAGTRRARARARSRWE